MSCAVVSRSYVIASALAFLGAGCASPAGTAAQPAATVAPSTVTPVIVPIRVVNNHVYVRMTSGGRDLSLIYDTGAGFTLLDIPVAQRLGFKEGSPANVGGAGTTPVRAFAISGGSLALPQDPTLKVQPVIALGMSLAAFEGIVVDGILGADFTRQSVLRLDYPGQRMLLYPRSFRYTGSGARIPITFKDGHPHAVGQIVLADGAQLEADCIIDVGASGALVLSKPFVRKNNLLLRVGPTIYRKAGRGVGGSSWATIGRVAAVRLGTAEVKSPVAALYGDSAGVMSTNSFDCNIGGEILRRFNVYFDYGRKEMILEPTALVAEPFEGDMSGAAFRLDTAAGGIRILDLMPKGPAAAAGLVEEDLIVSIDGRPALEYGMEALRRRLRRDGGEVEFRVRRSDGDKVIRVPVRRLV